MLINSCQWNLMHPFYESDKVCVARTHNIFLVLCQISLLQLLQVFPVDYGDYYLEVTVQAQI